MDIVDLVFHARLEALIHNLKRGKYFGSESEYIMRVIEYQHRGLPHAHIVFRLKHGPQHSNFLQCARWIEEHICTTMPNINEHSTEDDKKHAQLVQTCMFHRCVRGELYANNYIYH